jgi:hypothetical protein
MACHFVGAQTHSHHGLLRQHFKVGKFGYSRNDSFTERIRHHHDTVTMTSWRDRNPAEAVGARSSKRRIWQEQRNEPALALGLTLALALSLAAPRDQQRAKLRACC